MDESPNLLESIKTVRHFRKLNLGELTAIISAGQVRRFRIGETIFTEADPCAGMFVLIRGMVHLCKTGPQGQVNIMAVIEPVIMFN
jgi:signal-transduction protein with cAMP-binding, CBS, and nucleotidyltransferase domain